AGHHRLEAAGNCGGMAQAVVDVSEVDSQPGTRGRRGKAVHHVELTADRYVDPSPTPRVAVAGRADDDVADVIEAVPVGRDRSGIHQQAAMWIVQVDDGGVRQRRLEQPRLRCEVALLGAVQVQMIATEVGEDGDVEMTSGDALK